MATLNAANLHGEPIIEPKAAQACSVSSAPCYFTGRQGRADRDRSSRVATGQHMHSMNLDCHSLIHAFVNDGVPRVVMQTGNVQEVGLL
eukprot:scaffold1340_cov233-Amphora_coffeaeformis.AAC.3